MSMDDEKLKDLAEVLGNKTCKKIIDFLVGVKSASAKDISDELKIGMSGVDYNMKKLLKSGIVEKEKDFFWSKKGKKILMYKVSNKSVVISPKKEISSKFKSLIPAVMLVSVSTFAVYVFEKIKNSGKALAGNEMATPTLFKESIAQDSARIVSTEFAGNVFGNFWIWFLCGAVLTLIIFSILNWKKL
jgi:DNA-binding transcriptional ArsR family regulator